MTSSVAPATSTRFPTFRLLVLAGAIFVSVSSEFLPTGILPDIAADLGVSEARVGFLVSVFAGTVAFTSIPLTVLTRRMSRKALLVVTLAVFAVANLLAAIAPNYETLLAVRILAGLSHGVFWAVAGPYTALLVEPRHLARAVSLTTGGGSMAFIVGVPLTAAIGHALGWRLAFLVMAVVVVVFVGLVVAVLPSLDHRVPVRTGEIVVPLHRDRSLVAVVIVAVTVLLVATGHNAFHTYIAPWSIQVGGIPADLVSVELLVFGLAGLVGLLLAGVAGDRWPRLFLNLSTLALVVGMALVAAFGRGEFAVIALVAFWSLAFGGLPAMFHTRNLHASSMRVRAISGSIVTTAFNLAIGLGAFLGGLAFDGWGPAAVPWLGLSIVAAGLVWVLATDRARIAAHPAEARLG